MSEASSRATIDSRRLLYFYHVATRGSFSQAEGVLGAPQPVISRQIAKLEQELGLQLLERNGRGVTITRCGEILLRHAETILEGMKQAGEELDLARRAPTGQVRIAAPATFMTIYMPEVLRRFMAEFPHVELVAIQALTGEIYEKLLEDKVDIGIVLTVPNKSKFEVHELLVESMVGIVARSHPLATSKQITRALLAQQRLVVPSSAQGLRDLINTYMAGNGPHFTPHLQIDSVPLIRELVRQGDLATILPQSTAALEFKSTEFAILPLRPNLKRSLFAAHPKAAADDQYIRAMIHHILEVVRDRIKGLNVV